MLDVDRFEWLSFDVSAFPNARMLFASAVPAGPAEGSAFVERHPRRLWANRLPGAAPPEHSGRR